jgi:photosystem II stability/assembly factor-like uncharacterized protein
MKSSHILLVFFVLVICACQNQPELSFNNIELTPIKLNSKASFRGIHGNNQQIWLAGSNSEVWKYDVLNNSMQNVSPFQNSHVQFRDVECLGKDTAIIMTAGFRAMLLKTNTGGTTWDTVLQDNDSLAFFDGLDFENEKGILFGDPLNGMLQVFSSNNYGNTWQQDTSVYLKELNPIEAGFAASGTSILFNNGNVYISLGGNQARIFSKKSTWQTTNTPMAQGGASKGIYSLDFHSNIGVAVGGQYDNPNDDSTRIYTSDNGKTWQLGTGVNEYRSTVVMINKTTAIAGGPSGIDLSNDGGKTWGKINEQGVHAIYWPKNSTTGFASGADGSFYKIQLK